MITFIDFVSVFDSVNHKFLYKPLGITIVVYVEEDVINLSRCLQSSARSGRNKR